MTEVADAELVTVERVMSAADATAMVGSFPERGLRPTLQRPTIARDPDGTPVFAYLPLPPEQLTPLRRAVLGAPIVGNVRRAQMGFATSSQVFGAAPRRPQQAAREGCNFSQLHQQHPDIEAALVAGAGHFAEVLADIDPDIVKADSEYLDMVGADWRMGSDGLWTSGVINKNSQLPYHRDSLNFPTWSAMPVFRRRARGGHLHLPEWDTVLPCRDGWVVYWCGNRVLHGVTELDVQPGGYRYSVVYYALRGMKSCHDYAVETAYARTRRTEREDGMAAKLKSGELLRPDLAHLRRPLETPRPGWPVQ